MPRTVWMRDGIGGVRFDLAAQPAHVDVDGTGVAS